MDYHLPLGEYDAFAVIECDGYRTPNFNFTIVNGEGPDAGLLRLIVQGAKTRKLAGNPVNW